MAGFGIGCEGRLLKLFFCAAFKPVLVIQLYTVAVCTTADNGRFSQLQRGRFLIQQVSFAISFQLCFVSMHVFYVFEHSFPLTEALSHFINLPI